MKNIYGLALVVATLSTACAPDRITTVAPSGSPNASVSAATASASPVHVMLDVWWDRYQTYSSDHQAGMRNLLYNNLKAGDEVNVAIPAEDLYNDPTNFGSGCSQTKFNSFWALKDQLYGLLHPKGVIINTRVDFTRATSEFTDGRGVRHAAITSTFNRCRGILSSRRPWWISYDWEPSAGANGFSGDEFDFAKAETLFKAAHDAAASITSTLWVMPGYQSLGILNNLHFDQNNARVDWGYMSQYIETINFQTQRQLCGISTGKTRNGGPGDTRTECVPTDNNTMSSLFGDQSFGSTTGAVYTLTNEVTNARGANYPVVIQVSHNWSDTPEILNGIDKARNSTAGIQFFYIWYERASFPDSNGLRDLITAINSRFAR